MKKSKKTPLKLMSKAELSALGTKQLLSRLNRLRECQESCEQSDLSTNIDLQDGDHIYFKKTKKWKESYQLIKEILKNREHQSNWKRM